MDDNRNNAVSESKNCPPFVPPQYWCVIPAAGIGSRMGAAIPKQYLQLGGATILDHTLEKITYLSWLKGIVVVLSEGDTHWPKLNWQTHPKVMTCLGGEERVNSVYQALLFLADLAEPDDWVMVHDVARPCVSPVDIEHLKDQLKGSETGGLLGARINDTLKRVDVKGWVQHTVDRKNVWRALTPQMFRYRVLRCALEQALQKGLPVTDEASAVEQAGHDVKMVRGGGENIKITTPEDLDLAAYFLSREHGQVPESRP